MRRNDWIAIQHRARSDCSNLIQNILTEKLYKRFIKNADWPPANVDCIPLDYHFCHKMEIKVYGDQFNQRFAKKKKKRIKEKDPKY